ncbi:hypothetical protein [Streptomyces goshikiensis]
MSHEGIRDAHCSASAGCWRAAVAINQMHPTAGSSHGAAVVLQARE